MGQVKYSHILEIIRSHTIIQKVISGGQTGVDRAALDAAIEIGIDHGGYCPNGRRAEDGIIPKHYHLIETKSRQYHVRTEKNVLISHGTLILSEGGLDRETKLAVCICRGNNVPFLLINIKDSRLKSITSLNN